MKTPTFLQMEQRTHSDPSALHHPKHPNQSAPSAGGWNQGEMRGMAIGLTVKVLPPPSPILSQLFAQQILLHSPKAKAERVGWRQNSKELLKMTNSTKIKMKKITRQAAHHTSSGCFAS